MILDHQIVPGEAASSPDPGQIPIAPGKKARFCADLAVFQLNDRDQARQIPPRSFQDPAQIQLRSYFE